MILTSSFSLGKLGNWLFSVRLWNVPVAPLKELADSYNNSVEVLISRSNMLFWSLVWFLLYSYHPDQIVAHFFSRWEFMFGRMHFGKVPQQLIEDMS